ncbi:hypothetical protein BKA66DRAFT_582493 [Pyrenochaeta sp. MPI-SDFR-AT-0127]|nr:hypothetical protein BKA66DRAFT_582493 [Pyrenochaeta sp. MPI-SDFR-AT-0127]
MKGSVYFENDLFTVQEATGPRFWTVPYVNISNLSRSLTQIKFEEKLDRGVVTGDRGKRITIVPQIQRDVLMIFDTLEKLRFDAILRVVPNYDMEADKLLREATERPLSNEVWNILLPRLLAQVRAARETSARERVAEGRGIEVEGPKDEQYGYTLSLKNPKSSIDSTTVNDLQDVLITGDDLVGNEVADSARSLSNIISQEQPGGAEQNIDQQTRQSNQSIGLNLELENVATVAHADTQKHAEKDTSGSDGHLFATDLLNLEYDETQQSNETAQPRSKDNYASENQASSLLQTYHVNATGLPLKSNSFSLSTPGELWISTEYLHFKRAESPSLQWHLSYRSIVNIYLLAKKVHIIGDVGMHINEILTGSRLPSATSVEVIFEAETSEEAKHLQAEILKSFKTFKATTPQSLLKSLPEYSL